MSAPAAGVITLRDLRSLGCTVEDAPAIERTASVQETGPDANSTIKIHVTARDAATHTHTHTPTPPLTTRSLQASDDKASG